MKTHRRRIILSPASPLIAPFACIIAAALCVCSSFGADGGLTSNSLIVYPGLPGDAYKSDRYEVTVWQAGAAHASYVYRDPSTFLEAHPQYTIQAKWMSLANHFTSFSFSGPVVVEVKLPLRKAPLSAVIVRPLSKNLKTTISGNTISIPMSRPANIYVEIDGEKRQPLFVFANPLETDVPAPSDPNVFYFGPGLHNIGAKGGPLQDIPVGKSVYIAGGAYVRGLLKTTASGKLRVHGRGILSGVKLPHQNGDFAIDARRAAVDVEGITIVNCPSFTIAAFGSVGSVVENVKCLAWYVSTDGPSLGRSARISNCFFKLDDDAVKVGASDTTATDNVVWQQHGGAPIMLGWNAVGEVAHVKVSGLDIIASDCNAWKTPRAGNGAIVSLANIKDAKYRDIVIENVRSEVPVNQVFFLVTKGTAAGFDQGLGDVDGLVFRNISVPGKPRLKGLFNGNGTNTGAIKNVTFDNVRIGGTLLTAENADQHIEQQGKTSEFTYTDSPANKSKSP